MPRNAKVRLFFGDGEHDFALRIGELVELQEGTGRVLQKMGGSVEHAGPPSILDRLRSGSWLLTDLKEPLRLGLIGGGMGKQQAWNLVEREVVPGQLLDHVLNASLVLGAALTGAEDEPVGERTGAETTDRERSASPPSTE